MQEFSRVCDSCFVILTPDSQLTVLQLEQIDTSSPSKPEFSDSVMGNCPVCDVNLYGLAELDVENHVSKCIESYAGKGSDISGNRNHRLIKFLNSDTLYKLLKLICELNVLYALSRLISFLESRD